VKDRHQKIEKKVQSGHVNGKAKKDAKDRGQKGKENEKGLAVCPAVCELRKRDRHKKGEKKGKAIEGRVKLGVYMLGNVQWIKGRKDDCSKDGFSCIIEGKGENSSQVE
jgi:hypothetical protein